MLPFDYVEKNTKYHFECKFCGWVGKPWELPHLYECVDWNPPNGKMYKTVKVYCPKCRVLEPFEQKDDDKHYTEYRKGPSSSVE